MIRILSSVSPSPNQRIWFQLSKIDHAQNPSQQTTVTSFQCRPSQSSANASQSPSLRSVIFPAVAAALQTASSRGMATRLNFPNKTAAQLVRFAIVGFSLAALYSAIYWVLATYVMTPVLAVLVAFIVSVSLGFVLHSRWSFRGHGAREDHRLKVKFLAVQTSGFVLNEAFTWVLTGPMHGPTWWPLIPAIFVTPLATFALNKLLVFR